MPASRRIVRRIKTGQLVTFDDQLWPVNAALVILAGFVAGMVIAVSRFDDPRILYNGWARLASVALTTGLLVWGASRLASPRLRRGLQLSAVLSLLAHVVLMVLLYNQVLATLARQSEESDVPLDVPEELFTLPDFREQLPDAPPQEHERPVETAVRESETGQALDREATELENPSEAGQPTPIPGTSPEVEPSALALRERQEAAPRQADRTSRLSKQLARAEAPPAEQATPVDSQQPDAERPAELAAAVRPVDRREAMSTGDQRSQSQEPLTSAAQQAAALSRRENQEADPTAPSSVATLPRQVRQPSVTPTAADDAPQASPTAQATAEPARPQAGEVGRQAADVPLASSTQSVAAPSGEPGAAASAAMARAQATDTPDLTSQPAAAPAGRAVRAAPTEASPQNIEAPALAQSTDPTPSPLEPGRAALSKGTAGTVGGGSELNFERGLPGTRAVAAAPSGAAPRRSATQTGPDGPDVAPSAPATVPRSIAGARAPTSTLQAQDIAGPAEPGAARPSDVDASSSAAVARARATAPRGPTSAAVGTAPLDIGPTQIVASAGRGRISGGGAPSVRVDVQGRQIARSVRGGASQSAIASPTVADAPSAPATEARGSGGTAAPAATAAARSDPAAIIGAAGKGSEATDATGDSRLGPAAAAIARSGSGQSEAPTPTATATTSRSGRVVQAAAIGDARADAIAQPNQPSARVGDAPNGQLAGAAPARAAAGLPTRTPNDLGGALAGPVSVATATPGTPGTGLNPQRSQAGPSDAPTVAPIAASGPLRRATTAGVPSGAAASIDEPMVAPAPAGGAPNPEAASVAAAAGLSRPGRAAAALPVEVAAVAGPGGLGVEPAPQVGSLSRRAQPESAVVNADVSRFLNRRSGGPASIEGVSREPAQAFSRRTTRRFDRRGVAGAPTERTDRAVEAGLSFLARHQSPDGNWSLHRFGVGRPGYEGETASYQSDTAATGLALLAFLGGGYDHFDDQYNQAVRGGLEWLVKNQKADGDLYVPMHAGSNQYARFYSHGIAAIALCEAYGMTGDADLRGPAQKAIDFIVASQDPQRGAWRYVPGVFSDTSVTGWQLMALKSGELAGLSVPPKVYEGVHRWLEKAQAAGSGGSQYVYDPERPSEYHPRLKTRPTMTAVGLLMRLYLGWNRDKDEMIRGGDHLLANLPAQGTRDNPLRDTYYWYYGTQVMFHMKGRHWQEWNQRLEPLLVERQVQEGPLAGSWDPLGSVPDAWGREAGRIYVTAMNLLSLEVYYRHLPIYESTAK